MALGPDVVDGLGGLAAVEATATGDVVKAASPTSGVRFGAEVFQENTIPGQHAGVSSETILHGVFPLAMCR
jgi:hypothetical protein